MPGKILLADTVKGRIVEDAECKNNYIQAHPYGESIRRFRESYMTMIAFIKTASEN